MSANQLSSDDLAQLIADALMTAGLIGGHDFERVVAVIAEEIDARRALGDA